LVAVVPLLFCFAGTAAAAQKTAVASEGLVSATLSYQQGSDSFGNATFSNLQLTIERSGVSYYTQPVSSPSCGTSCLVEQAPSGGALAVRDLEGNGQPDVVLDLYTGGAHCCSVVQVFAFDPGVGTYRLSEHNFGDPGARLSDLSGDGPLEFQSADDRFAYEFAPYAYSGLPIRIWCFSGGHFIDVTREFPQPIALDAKRQWHEFLSNRRAGLALGFIAAWAADEDLLGKSATAAQVLGREQRAHRLRNSSGVGSSANRFIVRLGHFLKKTGYT
jgi:hypothetical protein